MDIKGKTILVLGAWGLVGNAITRKLMNENPARLILTSLKKEEAVSYAEKLRQQYPEKPDDFFVPWWGNIFTRNKWREWDRAKLLDDPYSRKIVMQDIMEELDEVILGQSALFSLIQEYQPEIIFDCINSATGIAYQDVYSSYNQLKPLLENGSEGLGEATERLLCTLYIPQLIRHIQILYAAMSRSKTQAYVKIGTSGTGGYGLNIPYTHSEEKPSRVLLSKSSVAGAHTMLLFLMGRTPNSAITKEVKPTAAIAWKDIAFDEVKKGGKPIKLFNAELSDKTPVGEAVLENKFSGSYGNDVLKSVFIDTGENGIFSRGEFEAITAEGQMEFVTPEEIADTAIFEVKGGNTGHDIINALDNATLEPTYRAGFLQHSAVERMKKLEEKHQKESVAFEFIGPPRLTKLLFEANLLKKIVGSLQAIQHENAFALSEKMYQYLDEDPELKREIISIGLAILLPDGRNIVRGPELKVPKVKEAGPIGVTDEIIDKWANEGWVDLRPSNVQEWIDRSANIIQEAISIAEDDNSSLHVRTKQYWNDFGDIDIGKVVSWIFLREEDGKRMKS